MLEVEVKAKINISNVEPVLKTLGFEKGTTVYEKDTYFNGEKTDLKAEDKALRIRLHKDVDTGIVKYVLNFKGPKIDDSTMTREETQFEVPDFEKGLMVLNGLGFFEAGGVEKTRIHYKKDDITCCLDRVTGLGDFLEIEIMAQDEAGYEAALDKIKTLLSRLGLGMDDTINQSYLCMLTEDSL